MEPRNRSSCWVVLHVKQKRTWYDDHCHALCTCLQGRSDLGQSRALSDVISSSLGGLASVAECVTSWDFDLKKRLYGWMIPLQGLGGVWPLSLNQILRPGSSCWALAVFTTIATVLNIMFASMRRQLALYLSSKRRRVHSEKMRIVYEKSIWEAIFWA
jgi:hypothetical protein